MLPLMIGQPLSQQVTSRPLSPSRVARARVRGGHCQEHWLQTAETFYRKHIWGFSESEAWSLAREMARDQEEPGG